MMMMMIAIVMLIVSGLEVNCAFKCGDMEDPDSCNLEDLIGLCRWTGSRCEYVPYGERDYCNGFSSGVCPTVLDGTAGREMCAN
jgi:hypothetical protein